VFNTSGVKTLRSITPWSFVICCNRCEGTGKTPWKGVWKRDWLQRKVDTTIVSQWLKEVPYVYVGRRVVKVDRMGYVKSDEKGYYVESEDTLCKVCDSRGKITIFTPDGLFPCEECGSTGRKITYEGAIRFEDWYGKRHYFIRHLLRKLQGIPLEDDLYNLSELCPHCDGIGIVSLHGKVTVNKKEG
jgi:hypothetical protein